MIEFEEGADALSQIRNFNGTIRVMETAVVPQTQQEYFRLNKAIVGIPNELELGVLIDLLFDQSTSDAQTRSILVQLTNSIDVRAFRCVERYAAEAPSELQPFASLCLEISRMRIENSLSDEEVGYIAGGMGGSDQKLRFFLLVFPASSGRFTPHQLQLTQDEFRVAIESVGGVVEVFDSAPLYFAMVILLPVKVDFRLEAEKCLKEINQYGNFLFPAVYATNVEIPTYPQILDIIEKMRTEGPDDQFAS